MAQSNLINLYANEYIQKFHYFLSVMNLDRCSGNFITLGDLSNRVCVPNAT